MDLVAASRAFLAVARHGSFTVGAAAIRVPQSVVSRRIAALESHLGGVLLDRTSRALTLTPFGSDLLPAARRLVQLAEALEHDAERARRRPLHLVVPAICPPRDLARLAAKAQERGIHLELSTAAPDDHAEIGVEIVPVPPDVATWRVPLGLATLGDPVTHVENLKDREGTGRAIWIQPEDDLPHVRDRLTRLGASVGLRPAQIVVASSLVAAAAEAMAGTDLLLCSAAQASDLGLPWGRIGELELTRGYDAAAGSAAGLDRVRRLLPDLIGCALGVPKKGS
ncbi:LysR family transcriptional regulator [Actinoplanes sp. NPDC051343]|jgi:DNA-binding transcriptional LysR family regulator|uniref:LysR family transcriptional regulator n=1 Tax=Actinoplanes sp. NPDC051343 TaxID=3363906 RepID=UPI0037A446A5